MRRSIFVFGPRACGHPAQAARLRDAFDLDTILDGWTTNDTYPADGALILTPADPRPTVGAHAEVYSVEDALDVAGAVGAIAAQHKIEIVPLSAPLAVCILTDAAKAIGDRAAARDCPSGERSMARCVRAFNAITGHGLTEVQGWHFMELLKLARATAGGHHLDDHVDRAAYAGLAGEAAEREARAA